MKKVNFKNVGGKRQHPVTLFEIYQKPFSLREEIKQSDAEKMLTHCWSEAKIYLKENGFEDTTGLFININGKIERYREEMKKPLQAMPLAAAIEERDKNQGQTGEYLAALIDYNCQMIRSTWPPTHENCSAVMDYIILIQNYHFQWYLLEKIQKKYSAGQARIEEASLEREMKSKYEGEAKELLQAYLKEGKTKEWSYKKVSKELKNRYLKDRTPTAGTIKWWFKSEKFSL